MLARNLLKYLPPSLYDLQLKRAVAFRMPPLLNYEITPSALIIPELLPTSERVELSLDDHTIAEIYDELLGKGVLVSDLNHTISHLSSHALAPKSLGKSEPVEIIEDILSVIAHAYASELDEVERQQLNMLAQLILTTSAGEWCDFWGSYFDVPRYGGESDADYTRRIIAEIFRQRTNKYAIENIIEQISRKMVDVYEPWTALQRVSDLGSELDNRVLYDARYWSYNTIDIRSAAPIDLLMSVGNKNRAAGVKMFITQQDDINGDDVVATQNETTEILKVNASESDISWDLVLDGGGYVDGYLEHLNIPRRWITIYDPSTSAIIDPVFDDEGKRYHPALTGAQYDFRTYYFAHDYDHRTSEDMPVALWTSSDFYIDELSAWGYYCSAQYVYLVPVPLEAAEFGTTFRKILELVGRRRKLKSGDYRLVSDGGTRYITNHF